MMAHRLTELEARRRSREVVKTVVAVVVSWCILLAVYFVVSPAGGVAWTATGVLVGGGLLFGVSMTHQFRRVAAAELPELRAVQALGTTVILFLLLFATVYLTFPDGAFSRPLNHVGALYFAITVFSTVGFGDITPETDFAQLVVAVQMLLDLVLIGVIVRAFFAAARAGLKGSGAAGEPEPPEADPAAAPPR